MDKKELVNYLNTQLSHQLVSIENELHSLKEEIAKETKSSAGDKFETSREMMNQERSRLEERAAHLLLQLKALRELNLSTSPTSVENGSLVLCDKQTFFFAIPFGKVEWNKKSIMVLSLNSPIGKVFLGKKKHDRFSFMNSNYTITSIS